MPWKQIPRENKKVPLFWLCASPAKPLNESVSIYRRRQNGEMERVRGFIFNPVTGAIRKRLRRTRIVMTWQVAA